jgi:putative transposase
MDVRIAHAHLDFSYHIVFIPKKRRRIFGGVRSEYAEEVFRQVAQEIGVKFDTLKVGLDHVHMLCYIPPNIEVSKALQILKSKSAHELLKQYPELRKELPPDTFWATGYFARTIGGLNEQAVRDYIQRVGHF